MDLNPRVRGTGLPRMSSTTGCPPPSPDFGDPSLGVMFAPDFRIGRVAVVRDELLRLRVGAPKAAWSRSAWPRGGARHPAGRPGRAGAADRVARVRAGQPADRRGRQLRVTLVQLDTVHRHHLHAAAVHRIADQRQLRAYARRLAEHPAFGTYLDLDGIAGATTPAAGASRPPARRHRSWTGRQRMPWLRVPATSAATLSRATASR